MAAAVAPCNCRGSSTADRCPVRRCGSKGLRPASTSSPGIRCRSSWRSCRRYRQQSHSTSPSRRRSQSAARAVSRVQVTQRRNVCAVEEISFLAPPWFGLRVPAGDLLQENARRNERCARKNCTPRVVLNTNSGRCGAGERIFSQTRVSGPMRIANRECVWQLGEMSYRRAACARETLAKTPRSPRAECRLRSSHVRNSGYSEFLFRVLKSTSSLGDLGVLYGPRGAGVGCSAPG